MADVFRLVLIFSFIYMSFMTKKPCFITSNGIENGENKALLNGESFISTSLWCCSKHGFILSRANRKIVVLCVLLLVCGDIESCPGPNIFDQKGLKITHQNIRGTLANFHLVQNYTDAHKIDVLTLSETHITENQNSSLFTLEGFRFLHKNRSSGLGGGMAVYVREGIIFNRRFDLEEENLENIKVEIFVNKSKSFHHQIHQQTFNKLSTNFLMTFCHF